MISESPNWPRTIPVAREPWTVVAAQAVDVRDRGSKSVTGDADVGEHALH